MIEVVSTRQQELWDLGCDARIEELVSGRHDASDEELCECTLELIYREVWRRESRSEPITLEEYCERFPQLSDRIERVFEIHDGLKDQTSHWDCDSPSADESTQQSLSGQRVGNLHIGRELGRGGVAVVYETRDRKLGRRLALKTLQREIAVKPCSSRSEDNASQLANARYRIGQEAAIMAALSHPGIPAVYDTGELQNGAPFFSMRLIEGQTLEQLLNDGLEQSRALQIFEGVASILASAHESNVIHRDLKPANIMVGRYGEVQIVDWGMAKRLHHAESPAEISTLWQPSRFENAYFQDSTSVSTQQGGTISGQILGTLAYMPPEQANGDNASHNCRTDVFAIGGILCRIITGRPPYRASNAFSLWMQAQNAELAEALTALKDCKADQQLVQLARDCLAESPVERPADALVVAKRMREFSESQSQRIQQAEIERAAANSRVGMEVARRRLAVTLAAAAIFILVSAVTGAVVFSLQQRNADISQARILLGSLDHAPPLAVPYVIDSLRPLRRYVLADLTRKMSASDDSKIRVRAAFALADFGGADVELIIAGIADADPADCQNFVTALRTFKIPGRRSLRRAAAKADKSVELRVRSRIGVLLMHLGDHSVVDSICLHDGDPANRSTLIHEVGTWHGDLSALAASIQRSTNEPVCSAITLGVATGIEKIGGRDRSTWRALLESAYTRSRTAEARNSAEFALQKWEMKIPEPAMPSFDANWTVNSQGMCLVTIPPGEFDRPISMDPEPKIQRVEVSRPFRISSQEVSVAQYSKFASATSRSAGIDSNSDPLRHPATGITFENAVRFCNWLSAGENLKCVYIKSRNGWVRQTGSGYRLPTEAEWEWACRAGSNRRYSFGDQTALLPVFSVCGAISTKPCATKCPNRSGLFDMHGNAWEWCDDYWAETRIDVQSITDPRGPVSATGRILKGGSFRSRTPRLKASYWAMGNEQMSIDDVGFRIAQDLPK